MIFDNNGSHENLKLKQQNYENQEARMTKIKKHFEFHERIAKFIEIIKFQL